MEISIRCTLLSIVSLAFGCDADDFGEDHERASVLLLATPGDPPFEAEEAADLDLPVAMPALTMRWNDVEHGVPTELADNTAILIVTNNLAVAAEVVLKWRGDLGTSRGYSGDLETIEVDAGADVEVAVDLATAFPTLDTEFSGYFHVKGQVTSEVDEPDQSASPGLYFHFEDDHLLIYDEKTLRFVYRAGDFGGLVDETADVVNEEQDSSLVRVVAEEPSNEFLGQPLGIGSSPLPSPAAPVNDVTQKPDPQFAHNQTLCVNLEVDTTDSGYSNSVGITEDYWASANSGITTLGYGAYVKIGSTDYITNTVGCITFTSPNSSYTANVRVYARALDANNSYIRLHDGPSDSEDDYPGSTYSWLKTNVAFSSGTTKYVAVGSYSARARQPLPHSPTR